MRHKKKGRYLNRTRSHRRWLLSNLITSLFLHERIRTTTPKAKEARPLAEKMITFAKRGDLHARRQVLRIVRDKDVVAKLFTSLSERFKDRPGGYTRIVKMGFRHGDNAPMAMLELMPEEVVKKSGGGKKRRSRRPKKTVETADKPVVEQAAEEVAVESPVEKEEQTPPDTATGDVPAESSDEDVAKDSAVEPGAAVEEQVSTEDADKEPANQEEQKKEE
jgi:large subunit ribosomal protein L17